MNAADGSGTKWTFLTNYSHVLLLLAQFPVMRIRDIAAEVDITERAVQRIIAELCDAGYLRIEKSGRRNRYIINEAKHLRHPVESHRTISYLLRMINS